jgi:hypothetical protein
VNWNPEQTWALVTWLFYFVVLVGRLTVDELNVRLFDHHRLAGVVLTLIGSPSRVSDRRPDMHIVVVGLSHKTAPVEIRKGWLFPRAVRRGAHQALRILRIKEGMLLSTCNRVEVYGRGGSDAG